MQGLALGKVTAALPPAENGFLPCLPARLHPILQKPARLFCVLLSAWAS